MNPSMPALAAPYAVEPGFVTTGPVTDDTMMMRPHPRSIMPGTTGA